MNTAFFPKHPSPDPGIIDWLLAGEVSIQYQVYRDLLHTHRPELRARIATEGWGKQYLSARQANGHWDQGFYQQKWTSTHYTLLDLRLLEAPKHVPAIDETLLMIVNNEKGVDGGINPFGSIKHSDVCVNGMFLNYACFFGLNEEKLTSIVDFLLTQVMPDGGFNCMLNRSGARHSSLHSTLSVLEGFAEYVKQGYSYRVQEVNKAIISSQEFILLHQLFLSDRTGKIIRKDFLKLAYPGRWRYDILRALDYFGAVGYPHDPRMEAALQILQQKRRKDGTWPLQAYHAGKLHFKMEAVGKPSRWNTLRVYRVWKRILGGFPPLA